MTAGLPMARNKYTAAVRELYSKPMQIVPKQPDRPKIKLEEMLHRSAPKKCSLLDDTRMAAACDCAYREDWIQLRNDWLDYNEWKRDYGHIKNGVTEEPKISMFPILMTVPGWPVIKAIDYIKADAKRIPNPVEIERLEKELEE
jgi:hypothetical protein